MRDWKWAAPALLLLAGCGGSGAATAKDPQASPARGTLVNPTASAPSGTTRSSPTVSVAARLASAGIDCRHQNLIGDVDCTYQGQKVRVSFTSWPGTEALRKRACDEGYVNRNYVVATDGARLTLAPDYNELTQAIARRLHLRVVHYCPT